MREWIKQQHNYQRQQLQQSTTTTSTTTTSDDPLLQLVVPLEAIIEIYPSIPPLLSYITAYGDCNDTTTITVAGSTRGGGGDGIDSSEINDNEEKEEGKDDETTTTSSGGESPLPLSSSSFINYLTSTLTTICPPLRLLPPPLPPPLPSTTTATTTSRRSIRVGLVSGLLFGHSVGRISQSLLRLLPRPHYHLTMMAYPSPSTGTLDNVLNEVRGEGGHLLYFTTRY